MTILYRPDQYSQQRQKEKKRWIYPVKLAMQAQHYRNLGHTVIWDEEPHCEINKIVTSPENISFVHLPAPDRVFTKSFDKKYQNNGNFKYHPGTYIQVADGCWHGKCTFCVERNNRWQVRPVWDVMQELESIERLGFKEVFDDSGTFPVGKWLDEFCVAFKKINVIMGCNARVTSKLYNWELMKQSGFRMVLIGVESVNQKTLDMINKGIRAKDIEDEFKRASMCGLEPHATAMVGFPNESHEDAMRTINFIKKLLLNGYAKTAQFSFYDPPDGKNNKAMKKYVNKFYEVGFNPMFLYRKIKDMKNLNDFTYLLRQFKEGMLGLWQK